LVITNKSYAEKLPRVKNIFHQNLLRISLQNSDIEKAASFLKATLKTDPKYGTTL